MRQPNHIILDFYNNQNQFQNGNWISLLKDLHTRRTYDWKNKKRARYGNGFRTMTFFASSPNRPALSKLEQSPTNKQVFSYNSWYNLININFLRKEKLYTKLKYSRSPAFDIVSGGAAALLAGLLGFLVSEKFGMELVDSGDFYYLWMYLVFVSFSVRPLLTVAESKKSLLHTLSLRRVYRFYNALFLNALKFFK